MSESKDAAVSVAWERRFQSWIATTAAYEALNKIFEKTREAMALLRNILSVFREAQRLDSGHSMLIDQSLLEEYRTQQPIPKEALCLAFEALEALLEAFPPLTRSIELVPPHRRKRMRKGVHFWMDHSTDILKKHTAELLPAIEQARITPLSGVCALCGGSINPLRPCRPCNWVYLCDTCAMASLATTTSTASCKCCKYCGNIGPIRECLGCFKVAYCSFECQRKGWKKHKKACMRLDQMRRLRFLPAKSCRCERNEEPLFYCSGCCQLLYCSLACQQKDWRIHKQSCLRLDTVPRYVSFALLPKRVVKAILFSRGGVAGKYE